MSDGPGNTGNGCFVRHVYLTVVAKLWQMNFLAGTVVLAGVPVTVRLITLAARRIVSNLGSYYAVFSARLMLSINIDFFTIALEM
jgi:hypothetical protein